MPNNSEDLSEQEKSILDVIVDSKKITSKEIEKLLESKEKIANEY